MSLAHPGVGQGARSLASAPVDATTTFTHRNFSIQACKMPISTADVIDDMNSKLGIPIPEMIFGSNRVAIVHQPSQWRIEFTAVDALDAVDKTGRHMLQVSYAQEWFASRQNSTTITGADVKEVANPYDWSYSTTYRGTEIPGLPTSSDPEPVSQPESRSPLPSDPASVSEDNQSPESIATSAQITSPTSKRPHLAKSAAVIPIELLMRRDPILFFDDVVLYESELDDNGASVFSVKLRVHEQRMLLLARLFMRLDNVLIRVRDTRVYIDFDSSHVIREYTTREASWDEAQKILRRSGYAHDELMMALRDVNILAPLLPLQTQDVDSVKLPQSETSE